MSEETARQVVEYYYHRDISGIEQTVNIAFFGGEPFLAIERMEQIVSLARERRPNMRKSATFCATTSGTVATPAVERLVRDAHMSLLISLDGTPTENRERHFASGRPSYEVVADNLPRLLSWTHEAVVRMTFHPQALDLLGNVRHVLALGAPSVALCPVEEADWEPHEARLEAAYDELADWFVAEARKGGLPPLEITKMALRSLHAARQGAPRPSRPCGVATTILGVDPDGNVLPCHRFLYRPEDRLGHVSRPELPAERLRYVHLSSSDMLGCDTCTARMVCGGGCRAVAVNAGRALESGTTPGYCITTRAHVRAATRIYDVLSAEDNPALWHLVSVAQRSDTLTQLYMQ
jgi:uncharacterized protein